MSKAPVEFESPIRTCVTFDANGDAASVRRVFCKRTNETVVATLCAHCPYAVAWPASLTDAGAAMRCRTSVPPPAKTYDVAETAIRTPSGEVMSSKLGCVRLDADMDMLGRLLAEDGLDALPVVDADGHPKGIVSKTDLLRALRDRDDLSAGQMMTPVVHALHEGAPVSFAIAMLALEDIEQIPVVSKDGVVVGLLTAHDLIRWMAHALGYEIEGRKP